MKSVCASGKIEEFLFALHQAHAGEASGTHGDQRLQQLKTRAQRVGIRIEKCHQPGLTIRHVRNQQVEHRQCRRAADDKPLPRKTRDKKHGRGDEHDVHRRAQVRLKHDQHHEEENRRNRGENGMQKIFLAEFHFRGGATLQVQKPSEVKDDRELSEFGGLDAHGAELDPAMGGVRLVEEKRSDEHEQHDANGGAHHSGLAKAAIIGAHQGKHAEDTEDEPGRLAQQENIWAAVLMVGGYRRRAKNHYRAKQAQRERHAE